METNYISMDYSSVNVNDWFIGLYQNNELTKNNRKISNETTMHGIYEYKYNNYINRFVLCNNTLIDAYRFPEIKTSFSSPVINIYNIHVKLLPNMVKCFNHTLNMYNSVKNGTRLMGYVIVDNQNDDYVKIIDLCITDKLYFNIVHVNDKLIVLYSRDTFVDGVINFDKLEMDYKKYADICKAKNLYNEHVDITNMFNSIKHKNMNHILYNLPDSEYVTNLLFGFPIEYTVAKNMVKNQLQV